MRPTTLPRCKIPQIANPLHRKIKSEVAKFGLYACALAAAGWFTLEPLVAPALARIQAQAQEQALLQFEEGWKSRLTQNQTLLRSACHTWWFGMGTKDRSLK